MKVICRSLAGATAMILLALAASNDLVSGRAFDVGFYALIAASAAFIVKGRCDFKTVC